MNFRNKLSMIAIVSSLFFAGCASMPVLGPWRAENLKYPVSMTMYIHNPKMNIVDTTGYYIVSEFSEDNRTTYLGPGPYMVLSSDSRDLSEQLNNIIKKHNGDGIVDFRIKDQTSGLYDSPTSIFITYSTLSLVGYLAVQYSHFTPSYLEYFSVFGATFIARLVLPLPYTQGHDKIEGRVIKFK